MRSYTKIGILLLFSILITVFVSPIVAGICRFNFFSIMSRTILVVTLLLFFYYRDRLGITTIGFELNRKWWLLLLTGFALGLFSLGVVSFVMVRVSIRYIVSDIKNIDWLTALAGYLATGFTVALIEECFFRGFILQALLKDTKLITALVITNVFYSAVHFLRPTAVEGIGELHLWNSLCAVPLFFKPLVSDFMQIWPSFIGLFLVGVVLSLAYIRIKQLSLPIGLHAGSVVGIKSLSMGTDVSVGGGLWANGKVVAHPLGWLMLLVFILILGWPYYLNGTGKQV